jgi:hypothetical protein
MTQLGFIQHLRHDVAWLYLTPSTRHGLPLFNAFIRLAFIQRLYSTGHIGWAAARKM